MKNMFRTAYLLLPSVLVSLTTFSGCRKDEHHFGRPIGEEASVAVSEVTLNAKTYLDQTVVVHGRIQSVCQSAGCWCILEDGKGQLYVSLSTFALPRDVAGKDCRVAGKLVMRSDRLTFVATGIDLLQK
jgi:hypothetical protein